MTGSDGAAALRSIYEAYQSRNFQDAAQLFAADAEVVNVTTGDRYLGPDGFVQQAGVWTAALPDLRVQVLSCDAAAGHGVAEYVLSGTHTGALISAEGFVPPTRAIVEVQICDSVAFRDGQIVRLHSYFDSGSLLRQMGLLPNSPLHITDRRAPLELYATEMDTSAQQRNKAIVKRFLEEVLNQHNVSATAAVCTPELVWHGGSMGQASDLPAFQNRLRSIFHSFPDLSVEVHDVIAENDRVAVRLTMRGTQLGHFRGVAPTRRHITSSAMNTFRIVDNRIAEQWWQHDLLGLMEQLDSPAPAPSS